MVGVDFKVLGKSLPRVDAREKVTGRASYAADVYLPGMLMCKVLTSPHSHARIRRIDTSKAEQLSGVRAVITGKDFPDAYFGSGPLKDRRIMARDEVFYVGEPVAAVAADDEVTAQEALELIDVEYQELEVVVDPLEGIGTGAPLVHPDLPDFEGYGFGIGGNVATLLDADRGEVDRAFQEADYVFEDTFRSQGISQGFLEPTACVANVEANGRLTLWASTQGPYQIREQLAGLLDISASRVKVIAMELGGGFGGKLRVTIEAFAALLSMKTGQPAKLICTREEAFTLNGPRLPTSIYLKTGVMKDGRIAAREAYSIFDVGAYTGAGPTAGVGNALGPYSIPSFRLRSYGIYTNKIYVGSYRASGVADMTFAIESHMDIIAHKLDMNPLEFRMLNLLKEGEISVGGAKVPKNGLRETLVAVKEKLDGPRTGDSDSLGSSSSRGVGIAVGEWRSGSGPCTASISINEDGAISLLTGSVDISGSDTALAQIAAETLGVSLDQVVVAKRDTDLAPYNQPSAGSRIVYSQGKAVQRAAEDARDKLFVLAAERLGVASEALGCGEGQVYVQDNPSQCLTLSQLARQSLSSRGGPVIGHASLSSMPYAPIFCTQAAEVVVDKHTGHVRVTRYIQAQDVGVAINPMTVEGQLEGGVVQGIGRALTEEIIFDPATGKQRNPSFTTYLMPLASDLPTIENVLVNVPSETGPFGARAVAEPPGFGPPAAIANAIYDAVGVRIKELPLSAERVLAALAGDATPEIKIDVDSLRQAEGLQQ